MRTDNAQGEIYLTDAVTNAAADGRTSMLVPLADPNEALGVNDRADLARVHRLLLDRHLQDLMRSGVTILEPGRTIDRVRRSVSERTQSSTPECLFWATLRSAGAASFIRAAGCATRS